VESEKADIAYGWSLGAAGHLEMYQLLPSSENARVLEMTDAGDGPVLNKEDALARNRPLPLPPPPSLCPPAPPSGEDSVHAPLPSPFQQVGSQQQEQKVLTGGSSAAGRINNYPSDFEHLLNDTELVTLEKAAQAMHGLEFYHGGRQSVMTFDFEQVREAVRESTKWAESKGHAPGEELYDEKEALQAAMGKYAVEGMAALRAWTCTVMCYVMHNMANRNLLCHVLPYARLLISALHALPVDNYLSQGTAPLYRGMRGKGLSDSWDLDSWDTNKKKSSGNTEAVPCNFHSFTSFTVDRDAALIFKGDAFEDELRTLIELRGAVGYKLQNFSVLPNEQEVLLEPVFCCTVEKMEDPCDDLDDVGESHYLEELKGFRRIYLRALPGIRFRMTIWYAFQYL